ASAHSGGGTGGHGGSQPRGRDSAGNGGPTFSSRGRGGTQVMTPAKILIVEDARITAEDLRDILTELGYTVTGIVSTGADAIREAGRVSPDLVMMDIHIKGDIDGIEAAR